MALSDIHTHSVCVCRRYSYLIYYRLQGNRQVILSHNLHHVVDAARCQRVATEYSVSLPVWAQICSTGIRTRWALCSRLVKDPKWFPVVVFRLIENKLLGKIRLCVLARNV